MLRDPFIQKWAERFYTSPLQVEDLYADVEEMRREAIENEKEKRLVERALEGAAEEGCAIGAELPGPDTDGGEGKHYRRDDVVLGVP